jgi:hypothetical protein
MIQPVRETNIGRRPGESAAAYHAFRTYCELGPYRSIRAAWHRHRGDCGKSETPAPGHWNTWSVKFNWGDRALAFDAEREAVKLAARAEAIRKSEERKFEIEDWAAFKRRVEHDYHQSTRPRR